MRSPSTLIDYGKRYLTTFFTKLGEFLWAQIIVGAILTALIFWWQVRLGLVSHSQVRASISALTYPYALLLVPLIFWHLVRAAYLIHLEDLREIERLRAAMPVEPSLVEVEPKSVDFRGEILELYFHKENDTFGLPSRTYILMKVQVVNHGPVEATVTNVGLRVHIGNFRQNCDLMKKIPENWRIRVRDERYLNMCYINLPIETCLGEKPSEETYPTAIPRIGWLAFELYSHEDIEFPNAEFTLVLVDSLEGNHLISRKPQLYTKRGDIIAV